MADKRISALPIATELQGGELFAVVQGGETKQTTLNDIDNYLIPTTLVVLADTVVSLNDISYQDVSLIRLTWSGANGTMVLNLPHATDNTNRVLRFLSNGGFQTSTRVELTPISGETLDGTTSPYIINKEYEGIQLWSDGIEWFIIQKKA